MDGALVRIAEDRGRAPVPTAPAPGTSTGRFPDDSGGLSRAPGGVQSGDREWDRRVIAPASRVPRRLVPLGLSGLAAAVSALGIDTPGLWLDEIASVAYAHQQGAAPWSTISRDGGNMVLSFVALHASPLLWPSFLLASVTAGAMLAAWAVMRRAPRYVRASSRPGDRITFLRPAARADFAYYLEQDAGAGTVQTAVLPSYAPAPGARGSPALRRPRDRARSPRSASPAHACGSSSTGRG